MSETGFRLKSTFSGGAGPDGLAFDPSTGALLVADGQSNQVLNTAGTGTVTNVGTNPAGIAVNSGTGNEYVVNEGSNSVSVINEATSKVVSTIPVGSSPTSIALDQGSNTGYVTNKGADTVSVINLTTNAVVATVTVGNGPVGIAVNNYTDMIYVTNSSAGTVSVINGANNSVVATITVGTNPTAVAVDPLRHAVWVANQGSGTVSAINATFDDVFTVIPVGAAPDAVAVDLSTNITYVANAGSNSVSTILGETDSVATTIPVGSSPGALAVNSATDTIYVANTGSNSISTLEGKTWPEPPAIILTSIASHSISISWEPAPNNGSPVTSYLINANNPQGVSAGSLLVPSTQFNATLSGLSNGIKYAVTVTPISALGIGNPSPVQLLTPASVPTAPLNLKAVRNASVNAVLTWTAPSSNGGSVVTGYKVFEGTTPGGESSTAVNAAVIAPGSTRFVVKGLKPNQRYYFTIKAVNAAGLSSASNEASMLTR